MAQTKRLSLRKSTVKTSGDKLKPIMQPAQEMRGTRPDGSGSNSPARPKTSPPSR